MEQLQDLYEASVFDFDFRYLAVEMLTYNVGY